MSREAIQRLMYALFETGLTVKEGTQRLAERGGPYEITSHSVWVDDTGAMHAAYLNEEKFLAAFLLATFPDDEAYSNVKRDHPGWAPAQILKQCTNRGQVLLAP